MTRYFDRDKNEQPVEWWERIYGDGARVQPGTGIWQIAELHDSGEPAMMAFQVRGLPRDVQPVLYNGGENPLVWKDEDGGYWEGLIWECYAPPFVGAYTLKVPGGDSLCNFGWICKTNHRHPQVITYAPAEPPSPPIPPEPPECPAEDIDAELDRIQAQARVVSLACQNLLAAVAVLDDAVARIRSMIF